MSRKPIRMKCMELLDTTCQESSIHGLVYLSKRKLHWIERIFWGLMISLAIYFSINICVNQWQRYRDNPIVYGMELARYGRSYPWNGVTLCADWEEPAAFIELSQLLWQCGSNETCMEFEYFWEFLRVVNVLRYDTLSTLKPYENDKRLKNFDFLSALKLLRREFLALGKKDAEPDSENQNFRYAAAVQEAGLCLTTSRLTRYTNPYAYNKPLKVQNVIQCSDTLCTYNINPILNVATYILLYMHSVYDVVSPNHPQTYVDRHNLDSVGQTDLEINWTGADDDVRNVPIEYRQCRYMDENNLKYFEDYRIGLCHMECRIDAALTMCNCKPFFYAIAPQLPNCSIDGLLCLVAKNWSQTPCSCMPLCDEIRYVRLQNAGNEEKKFYAFTVMVNLLVPHMAMKRNVIFSADQLLVSFGGAVSLFLGMSFISVYGLLYIFSRFVFVNIEACCKDRKEKRNGRHKIHLVNAI